MTRTGFVCVLILLQLAVAMALSARPAKLRWGQRTLDEDSTLALTIHLRDGELRLDWPARQNTPYWAILRSTAWQMTPAETLAITTDSFWIDYGVTTSTFSGYYQVLPYSLTLPPDSAMVIENFEGAVTLQSIPGEDDESTRWEVRSDDSYENSGHCLRLYGDTWKRRTIPPTPLEFGTVWQVAMKLVRRGEIQAIGIADSANWMRYIIWGSECPQAQVWLTTYQGWFNTGVWVPVYLPVGEDWHGRFGYLPRISELHFINDNDNTNPRGEVRFDELRDVTDILPYRPIAAFRWVLESGSRPDSVLVRFFSLARDPDSPFLSHQWDFGDGILSSLIHPVHQYPRNGLYTVTLAVTDDDNAVSWHSEAVVDSPVTQTRSLRMAFTGDIMLGRGYESDGGIIDTWGVDTIFTPTRGWIAPLDLASCNLECPLTTATTAHPTKGIVLKARPQQVSGLVNAGFDFATLANNHVFDYLEAGMLETMHLLDSVGIAHNGAGMNDLLARRTRFLSRNGLSLAMLSFSDRTGSYNNVQPFLDASRSRPGFAMWNRSAIEATVPEADALSDFVVLNVHSGSEYQYEPQLFAGLDPNSLDEDLVLSVVPDTNERRVRQYAIEQGADLVITHHPHIIQGFEVYRGKLIAHSLGNFVFDLTLAETLPSLIVHVNFSSESGIDEAVVHPVFLDHWIPRPATGQLGRAILDYESEMSRRLDTWLVRNPGEDSARIIWDTTAAIRSGGEWTDTLALVEADGFWVSPAHRMSGDGYPVWVESSGGTELRFGRDVLWFGSMESEGAQPWNLNSSDEGYATDSVHSGLRSIRLRRLYSAPDNVVTSLEIRKALDRTRDHSLAGWVCTLNATDASLQLQLFAQRSGGNALVTVPTPLLDGNHPWRYYSVDVDPPSSVYYFDVRMSLYQPSSSTGYAWFDDLALVEWHGWQSGFVAAPFPNEYDYVQARKSAPASTAIVHYRREWVE